MCHIAFNIPLMPGRYNHLLLGMTSAGRCHRCPTCRGEKEQRGGGQWRWGESQMLASVRKEAESTIPQDFLTGSDKKHILLTKQTNNTNAIKVSKLYTEVPLIYLGLI